MPLSPAAAFDFLRRAYEGGRLAHAYLITGEAGSGKRALALRLAKLVAGGADDIHAIEPESRSRVIRVEQTRELEKKLQMRASGQGRKVALLLDADRLHPSAANSFLKTLEEPPANSLLLLVSAHPEMLLETILSRCIQVQLAAPAAGEPTEPQRRLLDALARTKPDADLAAVFTLIREFTRLLGEAKSAIQEESAAQLKREETLYKQTTDAGKWLAEREEYYKALSESRYLQTRTLSMETLLKWWGDILRQQAGGGDLDFPAWAEPTARLAGAMSAKDVLRRIAALEALQENFGRNVQEQLAIEVAFLEAFGAAS